MDGKAYKENFQERESPILGEYLNIKKYKQEVVEVLVRLLETCNLKTSYS